MLDFYNIKTLFPDTSIRFQAEVREILDKKLGGQINDWWGEDKFPNEITTILTALGAFGELKPINQHSPLSYLNYGLLMYELERIDSGIRGIVSVRNAKHATMKCRQSQSFSQGYRSILPTSLAYFIPQTKGCEP